MPSIETIKTELNALTLLYQSTKLNSLQIEAMAELWAEDLEGMSDDLFIEAVRVARRGTRFFPTPCDILKAKDEVVERRQGQPQTLLALPQKTEADMEDQWEINKRGLALCRSLGRKKRIPGSRPRKDAA